MARGYSTRNYSTRDNVSRDYVSRDYSKQYVNNVEYGKITIPAGATTATTVISPIKNIPWIQLLGYTTDNTSDVLAECCPILYIVDDKTIKVERYTSDAVYSVTVYFCIADATSNLIKSIHYGSIVTSAATSGTAKIPAVDTATSAVFYLGNIANATATPSLARLAGITLTDSTTVTSNTASAATGTVRFVVVEFMSNVISSIQQFVISLLSSDSSTTTNKAISSVNLSNSFIAYGGRYSASDATYTIQLTSSTNAQLVRNSAISANRTINFAVIEFVDGILKSNQFANIDLTSATSKTATLNSVNISKTISSWSGYRSSTSDASGQYLFLSIELSSSTVATARVRSNSANTKKMAAYFIEFY